jgi:hypothetical protein
MWWSNTFVEAHGTLKGSEIAPSQDHRGCSVSWHQRKAILQVLFYPTGMDEMKAPLHAMAS